VGESASRSSRPVKPTIAVLPGDGIGPEVVSKALESIRPEIAEINMIEAGADRYLRTGEILSDSDLATIASSDALLFGAVGDTRVPDGVLERGILLKIRRELDLYVNLRPFPELGIVIVRENTEGAYAGLGRRTGDTAYEVSLNTRKAIARCARYACSLAESRSGKVTLVHKRNVMGFAGDLWTEVARDVAQEFAAVELEYEHADAAAYHLVATNRFDVILTDNLFGDILSDLAAGLGEGLGVAASANIHPDESTRPQRCLGLFEPVHGSAPDIAGTNTADPTAAIGAARMMLAALSNEALVSSP
jgi:3-isopropylmalate dehydrogenase